MDKKDILLIAHFCSDFDSDGNNRFNYLANMLSDNGYDVELVTSDFSHITKNKRAKTCHPDKYKVTFIEEPCYSKNVSIKRFYSHYVMGRNLKKYFKSRKKPEIIYCSVPSLDIASVAAEYAMKNKIRFVIDVQDLWPEAFQMIFNIPIISKVLFYPMLRKANYIYKAADDIVAVSQTYVDRALNVNNKCKDGLSIFLGTDFSTFDYITSSNLLVKPDKELWLVYIGTLGHSYDLTIVIDALKILQSKEVKNLKFIIIGDGPLKNKFEKYAEELGVYAQFIGRLCYKEMVQYLKLCDMAVNPIVDKSVATIINKHADYVAAGLPILNTQKSEEYRSLLIEYEAGFNSESNDPNELSENILKLYNDADLRSSMGRNSRKLGVEKFDRNLTYTEIIKILD